MTPWFALLLSEQPMPEQPVKRESKETRDEQSTGDHRPHIQAVTFDFVRSRLVSDQWRLDENKNREDMDEAEAVEMRVINER